MPKPTTVSVRILDKEYQVACEPDEVDDLTASARLLNDQMSEIRSSGKVIGMDRIAVMAALNLAHELLKVRTANEGLSEGLGGRVTDLTGRIEEVLKDHRQLGI